MGENNGITTKDELGIVKKQAEEYLNNWKRERADFVNYKKDEIRRAKEIIKFSNEGLITEIIEVLDKLDLGLKHSPSEVLERLVKDFDKFLNKYSVERIKIGEKFNPILHEAIEVEPGGQRLEEVRAGYLMHEKVIRPTRVKIIK